MIVLFVGLQEGQEEARDDFPDFFQRQTQLTLHVPFGGIQPCGYFFVAEPFQAAQLIDFLTLGWHFLYSFVYQQTEFPGNEVFFGSGTVFSGVGSTHVSVMHIFMLQEVDGCVPGDGMQKSLSFSLYRQPGEEFPEAH